MTDSLPQDNAERSLWATTAIADPVNERLETALRTDVLVVGGGYTGLSSALHLAERGIDVALLEARCIGYGGSGRNAGLVNAGVWRNPDHVRRVLGDAAGERFNLALRDSPALVFELVERCASTATRAASARSTSRTAPRRWTTSPTVAASCRRSAPASS